MATTKNKRLTDATYIIIRNDIPLKHKIAKALEIEPESVRVSAKRKSRKLMLPFVLDIIIKHLGKSKDEILEPTN